MDKEIFYLSLGKYILLLGSLMATLLRDLLTRFISRIVLLPVVSGLSYEYIKFAGKYTNNSFVRVIIKPGLWLQKFTTREPDDSMLEVAIQSLLAVIKAEEGDDYIYSNTYDKDIVTNKPSLEV